MLLVQQMSVKNKNYINFIVLFYFIIYYYFYKKNLYHIDIFVQQFMLYQLITINEK